MDSPYVNIISFSLLQRYEEVLIYAILYVNILLHLCIINYCINEVRELRALRSSVHLQKPEPLRLLQMVARAEHKGGRGGGNRGRTRNNGFCVV